MEIHAVGSAVMEAEIERLKTAQVKRKLVEPYVDPLREFSRVSRVEGMVRHWLTYPIEERKRLLKDQFVFVPQMDGETDAGFRDRMLERWRALSVIMQEESRMRVDDSGEWIQGSVEIATGALKLMFPAHEWKQKAPATTPEK